MNLNPVGEPHDIVIRMSEDTLPDPAAILVTGITPQKTLEEGITEAEFLRLFHEEIAVPDTVFVGYNTVRFDDEFMRYLHFRNIYDPYEWQWKDGKSKWDLLDLVRMARALRPEGIEWPIDAEGKPTNRLELLTEKNNLAHENAHDALSDVLASIAVARMLRNKQPKLFDYLLGMRNKKKVQELVEKGQPFIYASGKYDSAYEKVAVVVKIASLTDSQGAFVYDLRHDPRQFIEMSDEALLEAWQWSRDKENIRLPVKALKYNRCPAVAPIVTLDADSAVRLSIDAASIKKYLSILQQSNLGERIVKIAKKMDEIRSEGSNQQERFADERLYEAFIPDVDKPKMSMLRVADMKNFDSNELTFKDKRLQEMLPLYRARNYPEYLNEDERSVWESHRSKKLLSGTPCLLDTYGTKLQELAKETKDPAKQFLLEELTLYGQSIVPVQDD